jgi:hypothetical protein
VFSTVRIGGGRRAKHVAPAGAADPYPLYTSFDRNELPFHTAAGSWGAQVPFEAPTPPTTTRSVTVNTTGEFNTEAAVAGTAVTVGTSFSESSLVTVNANDVDVIVPNGISIGGIMIGTFNGTARARIRVRKATADSRGGRIGEYRVQTCASGEHTDLIVDSVDNNGAGSFGNSAEDNMAFVLNGSRVFIHNVRALCGQALGFQDAKHVLIALCSLRSSAVDRTTANRNEGWCIRGHGSPLVIVDSHLETTRYHVIRPNTYDNDNEYFYIARSKLVNLSESKIGWLGNKVADPAFGFWWGSWVKDCEIYSAATSTCSSEGGTESQVLSLSTCTYSRITGNTFYSGGTGNNITWAQSNLTSERNASITAANADSTLSSRGRVPLPSDAHSSDSDLATNTFSTLTGRPSWGGAGDPTGITLPNSWTLNNSNTDGDPTCAAVW